MASLKEGWLVKQGQLGYNRKYAILQNNLLLIFDKEPGKNRSQPKSTINIQDCTVRPAEGVRKYGFSVSCPLHKRGKTIYLGGSSPDDSEQWIQQIREASKSPTPIDKIIKIPDRWAPPPDHGKKIPPSNNTSNGKGGPSGNVYEQPQQQVIQQITQNQIQIPPQHDQIQNQYQQQYQQTQTQQQYQQQYQQQQQQQPIYSSAPPMQSYNAPPPSYQQSMTNVPPPNHNYYNTNALPQQQQQQYQQPQQQLNYQQQYQQPQQQSSTSMSSSFPNLTHYQQLYQQQQQPYQQPYQQQQQQQMTNNPVQYHYPVGSSLYQPSQFPSAPTTAPTSFPSVPTSDPGNVNTASNRQQAYQ